MRKRIEAVERRLDDIEKTVSALRTLFMSGDEHGRSRQAATPVDSLAVKGTGDRQDMAHKVRPGPGVRTPRAETPGLLHNSLGEPYSIKLVYPTFYRSLDVGIPYCTISFPAGKEGLAKQVQEGTQFFIYVTSPVRRVIGLARAMGPAEYRGEVTPSRPWVIPMEWLIGPKAGGVSLAETGLEVRARPGDSVYAVPEDNAVRLMDALRLLRDLDEAELARLRSRLELDASRQTAQAKRRKGTKV
jgi:hypothetical protein